MRMRRNYSFIEYMEEKKKSSLFKAVVSDASACDLWLYYTTESAGVQQEQVVILFLKQYQEEQKLSYLCDLNNRRSLVFTAILKKKTYVLIKT